MINLVSPTSLSKTTNEDHLKAKPPLVTKDIKVNMTPY